MAKPTPDNVPRTIALERLSQTMGTQSLALLLDQIGTTARETQQSLGQVAMEGDQERIADLAATARADCEYVGATGLAARLGALEARARRHELVDPLAEVDAIFTELDVFLEALEGRRERRPR